jgi:hypothetical protein
MRLKFKYIVLLGVALTGLQAWLNLSERTDALSADSLPDDAPVKVFAREANSGGAALTIIPVPVTNWPSQLGAILTTDSSTTNKAISLLGLFPNLSGEGQVEAAQHASRLLPDNYYSALGTQITNSAASPAARRAVFADLLTRPNSVKLPWLVAVASAALDEQAEEAALLLKAHFNEDYGTDWTLWRERVATWLARHPDQPVPAIPGMAVSN